MKITLLIVSIATVMLLGAQDQKAPKSEKPPKIEKTQAYRVRPSSGLGMFKEYCAPCHGMDGKGNGPTAAALKKAPADLTMLAARNGGKFPDTRVYGFIQGTDEVTAHGSREMPVWGQIFRSMATTTERDTLEHQRIANLTEYLKKIQK